MDEKKAEYKKHKHHEIFEKDKNHNSIFFLTPFMDGGNQEKKSNIGQKRKLF